MNVPQLFKKMKISNIFSVKKDGKNYLDGILFSLIYLIIPLIIILHAKKKITKTHAKNSSKWFTFLSTFNLYNNFIKQELL